MAVESYWGIVLGRGISSDLKAWASGLVKLFPKGNCSISSSKGVFEVLLNVVDKPSGWISLIYSGIGTEKSERN
jgi:hypothetical protein